MWGFLKNSNPKSKLFKLFEIIGIASLYKVHMEIFTQKIECIFSCELQLSSYKPGNIGMQKNENGYIQCQAFIVVTNMETKWQEP